MKVRVEYQAYISQKMAVSGALVFHKHFLFTMFSIKENGTLWATLKMSSADAFNLDKAECLSSRQGLKVHKKLSI